MGENRKERNYVRNPKIAESVTVVNNSVTSGNKD
jgi:hypothetical protein